MIRQKEESKKGRPTKYQSSYAERAYKLSLLGLRNKDLAVALNVQEATITNWMNKYEEFKEAILKGREQADAEVAKSLYQRAIGYSHPEEKVFTYKGEPIKVQTIKYYPPDTNAAIFWLQNRQRDYWKSVRHYQHSGEEGGPIKLEHSITNIDLSDFSDQELEMLESIGIKIKQKQEDKEEEE